jgi:hypothetical protein
VDRFLNEWGVDTSVQKGGLQQQEGSLPDDGERRKVGAHGHLFADM